jgi:hypothetical protein
MKIHFLLAFPYQVRPGVICNRNIEALGKNDPAKAFVLEYMNDEFWQGTIEVLDSNR